MSWAVWTVALAWVLWPVLVVRWREARKARRDQAELAAVEARLAAGCVLPDPVGVEELLREVLAEKRLVRAEEAAARDQAAVDAAEDVLRRAWASVRLEGFVGDPNDDEEGGT